MELNTTVLLRGLKHFDNLILWKSLFFSDNALMWDRWMCQIWQKYNRHITHTSWDGIWNFSQSTYCSVSSNNLIDWIWTFSSDLQSSILLGCWSQQIFYPFKFSDSFFDSNKKYVFGKQQWVQLLSRFHYQLFWSFILLLVLLLLSAMTYLIPIIWRYYVTYVKYFRLFNP